MSKIKVGAVQMQCVTSAQANIKKAEQLVRLAASEGAKIILLPELYERLYFCQEKRYEFYNYATPLHENEGIKHFQKIAKELQIVMPISFYEKDGNELYNSVAMVNHEGEIIGTYRKTHIPDDHFYQEKFYFKPGNTGFQVFDTIYGKIGVGICWDQWFPETARCLALQNADIILYPTAIGSEPILDVDSKGHWQRVMQGHSGTNVIPVVAANRIGTEEVFPCQENGNQSSSLKFYGSSFMTDERGEILAEATRDREEVIFAEYDFSKIKETVLEWGMFRDRRPELYTDICK